jgi:hypothetical protein
MSTVIRRYTKFEVDADIGAFRVLGTVEISTEGVVTSLLKVTQNVVSGRLLDMPLSNLAELRDLAIITDEAVRFIDNALRDVGITTPPESQS